mmetsp:Transcript_29756/g.98660  ORF Transcript_29756/g.98660 Transcript_29756/m.98660 type:complete len:820 (+) Transcript_29756:8028-10487(+)
MRSLSGPRNMLWPTSRQRCGRSSSRLISASCAADCSGRASLQVLLSPRLSQKRKVVRSSSKKTENGTAAPKESSGETQAAPISEGNSNTEASQEQASKPDGNTNTEKSQEPANDAVSTSALILGSEQDQQVYFDQSEKIVYIGDIATGLAEDAFTAELVFALRHALPLLFDVDGFLLEALLRCALKEGTESIPSFLEKRDIKVDTLAPRHLGPGDPLPEDLQENLVWSMHATFGEGENAAVMNNDSFIIAEVLKWQDDKKKGDGLNRSYMVRIDADTIEAKKHFEVYKILSRSAASRNTELALIPDEEATDKDPFAPDEADIAGSSVDLKQLVEVKAYLREMANMTQDDYKAVMRRLFKTWHPDKVGDTPLANRIFHMLRMHEHWYKKKISGENVGDDSWLDKEDLGTAAKGGGKGASAKEGALALTGRTYQPAEGGQSSWFDEFEREIQQQKQDRDAGVKRKEHPRMPEVAEREESLGMADSQGWMGPTRQAAQDGPTRMVDRQLSARFLQEAKVELVCVRRLLKECDGLRSVPPRAVFHCQQAVEMGLNSAMLRTCGVSEDEVAGGAAHDLIDFIKRIRTAETNTAEQRRAQQVPLTEEDVDWLKRAYLASRYPKPGRWGVPALLYDQADGERALRLAEGFVEWAERVEDLPDPGKKRRSWNQFQESKTIETPLPQSTPIETFQFLQQATPAAPAVPRLVLPPPGKAGGPAPAGMVSGSASSGVKRPFEATPSAPPTVGPVQRPAAAPAAAAAFSGPAKRGAGEAVGLAAADSGKRQRPGEVAAVSAAAPAASADAGGGGDGASGKRWARRLRKAGS